VGTGVYIKLARGAICPSAPPSVTPLPTWLTTPRT